MQYERKTMQREIEQDVNKYSGSRCNISNGYGALTLNALTYVAIKERVQRNLKWMSKKYLDGSFWTVFDGRQFRGVIINVGWCAKRGYAAKVLYKD